MRLKKVFLNQLKSHNIETKKTKKIHLQNVFEKLA